MKMIHAMLAMPAALPLVPSPAHGESAVSPSPVPSSSRHSDTTEATTAPAMIAPQETAEKEDSAPGCASREPEEYEFSIRASYAALAIAGVRCGRAPLS